MKNILIAGAGHGGLVAAAELAKKKLCVTVIEAKTREELGHDWEDRFTFSVLSDVLGIKESELPRDIWRYRGDCAFISPAKRKKVVINYTAETRQRIMWRKPLIEKLIDNAERCGVKFMFSTNVVSPITESNRVTGLKTSAGEMYGDLVIDAAGVFSPVRSGLPDSFGIEKEPKHGDVFYAYRAYFNRKDEYPIPDAPFEIYLYHEGERGLSWFCTNEDSCDVLIGRTDRIDKNKVDEQLAIFKKSHPWLGDDILHGGSFGVIPVRRPLTLMVGNGYAAVGDSAFMTTPMNGMGIDLSLNAGRLLAATVAEDDSGEYSANTLWRYNRDFHRIYGGDTAKNEGLKNSLLSIPSEGVDFLFESEVIRSSDLAGAGKNTKLSALLGKLLRGMKKPRFFFAIIGGLMKGSKAASAYKNVPERYDVETVRKWSESIKRFDIRF